MALIYFVAISVILSWEHSRRKCVVC